MYARINLDTLQMIDSPCELPSEYCPGDGVVIQNFNKLKDSILYDFGWVPVIYPVIEDPLSYVYSVSPTFSEVGKCFIYELLPVDLGGLKEKYKKEIDEAASAACSKYISTGIGQEMRYLEKYAQAKEYISLISSSATVDENLFPMLLLEANSCGMTLSEKAEEIVSTRESWVLLAAAVESLRMGGKVFISNSNSAQEITAKYKSTIESLKEL